MQLYLAKPGGQKEGPYSLEQIQRDLAAGKYRDSDFWAWHEGLPRWMPLYEVPGIHEKPVFTAPAPTPIIALPEPKPEPAPTPAVSRPEPKPEPAPTPVIARQKPKPVPVPIPEVSRPEPKPEPAPTPVVARQKPKPEPVPTPEVSRPEPKPEPAPTLVVARPEPKRVPARTPDVSSPKPKPEPAPAPVVARPVTSPEPARDTLQPAALQSAPDRVTSRRSTPIEPSVEASTGGVTDLKAEVASGLPFAALEQIFIFTTGEGRAVFESPIVIRKLEEAVGTEFRAIRGSIFVDVIGGLDVGFALMTEGAIPEKAWRAMSAVRPFLTQRAKEGGYHVCIRPFPVETQDSVALFLLYDREKCECAAV